MQKGSVDNSYTFMTFIPALLVTQVTDVRN